MNSNPRLRSRMVWLLTIAPLVSLALSGLAGAQVIVTVHPVQFSIKVAFQDFSGNGNFKLGKYSLNEKDMFEICTGEKPRKSEGIFLALDCDEPNNNRLVLANTNPDAVIQDIGNVEFDVGFDLAETSGDDLKKVVVPAALVLLCEVGDPDPLEVRVRGIATVKFKGNCPLSASIDISGTGELFGEDLFIIDTQSKMQAKNRTEAVEIPLVELLD